MQFYLNGYRVGDPDVLPAAANTREAAEGLAREVDVLIVGCGPAGLVLAAQLAAFPDIKTRIVDRRPGPLELGQADGIACRTVEMFNAFGFAERLLREAYWVNETVFWKPDPKDPSKIVRSGRIQDVEDDLSEFPHVICNQARVHDYLLEVMRKSPARLAPHYNLTSRASPSAIQVIIRWRLRCSEWRPAGRDKRKRSAPATSSAAMARAAASGNRLVDPWWATWKIKRGASWMSLRSPTSRTFA